MYVAPCIWPISVPILIWVMELQADSVFRVFTFVYLVYFTDSALSFHLQS